MMFQGPFRPGMLCHSTIKEHVKKASRMIREVESLSHNRGLGKFRLSGVAKCRVKGDMSISPKSVNEKNHQKKVDNYLS